MDWVVINSKGIKENTYEISKKGIVRYINNGATKKISINGDGYSYIGFYDDGKRIVIALHRLLAIHFLSRTDDDIAHGRNIVHFKDFDHNNISVDNLEWVNSVELYVKTKIHYEKPTKPVEYADYICRLLERDYDNKSICDILSVSRFKFGAIISNIRRRRIYKDISKKYSF